MDTGEQSRVGGGRRRRCRGCEPRAFTLTELLVVIGLIGVLIGLIIPVVGKMRQAGYKADTSNQLNVLRSAIEAYQQTFQAYPGPVSDLDMYGIGGGMRIDGIGTGPARVDFPRTGTENLVLGLLGGLEKIPSAKPIQYNPGLVGAGPRSLNPGNPKAYEPFLNSYAGWLSQGVFIDPLGIAPCRDTNIPEFIDRYPSEPMPILYLRARPGASGIISSKDVSPNFPYQYDIRQINRYTCTDDRPTPANFYGNIQGLTMVGKDPNRPLMPFNADALPYFRNPTLDAPGTPNGVGTPRNKDGFILISAGPDRTFGTLDDITTFGNVGN